MGQIYRGGIKWVGKKRRYCEDVFGTYVDLEERFFICPECDEPIYEEDYEGHDFSMCPICEVYFELVD